MTAAAPARIGFAGAGWRTAAYFTAMRALPAEFEPIGALTRTEVSAARVADAQTVATTTSLDEFLALGPFDFVITSVPWPQILPLASTLLDAGCAVLSETPIAESTELVAAFLERHGPDARIQSAEQYRFQPMHAARIEVARSGRIGTAQHVSASFAHDYHALSVVRAALGIGFEPFTVSAVRTTDLAVHPIGRDGWAESLDVAASDRMVGQFRWPERGLTASYDFVGEQYFSPIRSRHILIRGTNGELADDVVRSIHEPGEPGSLRLHRADTGIDGDLEGHFLRDIRLGDLPVWRTTFGDARLSDDELAIAEVLRRMTRFARDGVPFYGIADAVEDQYLAELMQRAAATGVTERSAPQAWHSLPSHLA